MVVVAQDNLHNFMPENNNNNIKKLQRFLMKGLLLAQEKKV